MLHKPSMAILAALACMAAAAHAQHARMSFFITSVGSGQGANLDGLEGADKHCQTLAEAAGAGDQTWRAYLSTQGEGAVNARDRIGKGPWHNHKGEMIAMDAADLHKGNTISKTTGLTEKGEIVQGRGDKPNMHDILTGSQPDGMAFPAGEDRTCGNWTLSGPEGAAMVGHHDRIGLNESDAAKSWNSSHPSRGGCSLDALKGTGGNGFLYCFAGN